MRRSSALGLTRARRALLAALHHPGQRGNQRGPQHEQRQRKQGQAQHTHVRIPQGQQRKIEQDPAGHKQGHKPLGAQALEHACLLKGGVCAGR
ncbi:hypothetical protein RZS08_57580, partial [Arthrospira platensis SPKY1]|nr:hypothetical protein [Arthrospira platensis SPKY1]